MSTKDVVAYCTAGQGNIMKRGLVSMLHCDTLGCRLVDDGVTMSSRRQAISATVKSATNQLGDNLFRLSVCFVLIEQNKFSKKAVLSQRNHVMLLLISNMKY